MIRIIVISIACQISYTFTSSIYVGSKKNIESQTQYSKYDFEEKILEKLVRLEHKMEINEQKVKSFEESVMFKLNDFNDSEKQRKQSMQSMIDTFKDEKNLLNSSLVNAIEDVMIKTDSLADEFTAKFNQLRKDHSSTVLFKAVHLQSDNNLQGKILVFNNIITNDGNGYNNNNGIFIAPVSDVYLFSVQLCPDIGDHATVYIIANGKRIGKLSFKNSSDIDDVCAFSNGIQRVMKGQKVWIYCSYANHKGDVIYNTNVLNNGNIFSGILLNPN